uniref:Uncharacterized protein n=1 Tax=Arundo donax TaxID=35708 RepID=A0A0A9B2Y6_ARUDO
MNSLQIIFIHSTQNVKSNQIATLQISDYPI